MGQWEGEGGAMGERGWGNGRGMVRQWVREGGAMGGDGEAMGGRDQLHKYRCMHCPS